MYRILMYAIPNESGILSIEPLEGAERFYVVGTTLIVVHKSNSATGTRRVLSLLDKDGEQHAIPSDAEYVGSLARESQGSRYLQHLFMVSLPPEAP